MIHKIFDLFLIFSLLLLKISFGSFFSSPHPLLVGIIFIAVMVEKKRAFLWALAGGVLWGWYGLSNPFFEPLILLSVVFFLDLIFSRFLTNRSLYSLLLLGIFGTAQYFFFTHLLQILGWHMDFFSYSRIFDVNFFRSLFLQILENSVLLFFLFIFLNFSSQHLKSVFLMKNRFVR